MIDERYNKYIPVCDCCEAELDPQVSFQHALSKMQDEGWTTKLNEDTGEWTNFCSEECADGK